MVSIGNTKSSGNSGGALGLDATLWLAADRLRCTLDTAENKHVVLGVLFLNYISDAFADKHPVLVKQKGAAPEGRDECINDNISRVLHGDRSPYLQVRAKDPLINKLLGNAKVAIERESTSLKGEMFALRAAAESG